MPSASRAGVVTATIPDAAPTLLEAGGPNAIGRMLGIVGDEWTLLILQRCLRGNSRYGQFLEELPISNAVLTGRLAGMERDGLLVRVVYQERPVRAEYVLTPRGRALWPVLIAIWDWERQWVAGHAQTLPAMFHTVCGNRFAPLLACRSCHATVSSRAVETGWGPSGTWERSAPASVTRRRSVSGATVSGVPRPDTSLFPETMALFGNRWSAALIGAALQGVARFGDFAAALGAPPSVVAERLRAFCDLGVLETVEHGDRRDWVEYRLTAKGLAFYPAVALALEWAGHWFVAPEGPALLQRHRGCGQPLAVRLVCDRCHADLHGGDIDVVPRPHRPHRRDRPDRPDRPQSDPRVVL